VKISELISVSVKNGTAVFSPKEANTSISVIGCSCTIARKGPATFDRSLIVVRPQIGVRMTVIGLTIGYESEGRSFIINAFICIYLKDGTLYVNLGDHCTFSGGAISSGDKFQAVVTLDGGKKFAHYTHFLQKGMKIPEGFQIVDDIDLLFQFAAGVIDLETLESYATNDMRTAERVEIEKLRQQIVSLEAELGNEKGTALLLGKRFSDLELSNQGLRKTLEEEYRKNSRHNDNESFYLGKISRLKSSILRVKECVSGFGIPWIFPWYTVSVCRDLVRNYTYDDLK